jgi:hypothetical protein
MPEDSLNSLERMSRVPPVAFLFSRQLVHIGGMSELHHKFHVGPPGLGSSPATLGQRYHKAGTPPSLL